MTAERLVADYTRGLTVGVIRWRCVATSSPCGDFARLTCSRAASQRIRVAGMVITRQRPGTARFRLLTLEDETGIVNIIFRGSLARDRPTIVEAVLIVDGAAGARR
jgi:hypothetical protein